MSRGCKTKKDKVPKLTEEEYVKYISALKGEESVRQDKETPASASPTQTLENRLEN